MLTTHLYRSPARIRGAKPSGKPDLYEGIPPPSDRSLTCFFNYYYTCPSALFLPLILILRDAAKYFTSLIQPVIILRLSQAMLALYSSLYFFLGGCV
ncbi:hypothetical protein F4803DRAFT_452625 [Xylaria telfairii]|nr:hypothetical protein F4803DRAFT_452625 [Xylaria telfairii]